MKKYVVETKTNRYINLNFASLAISYLICTQITYCCKSSLFPTWKKNQAKGGNYIFFCKCEIEIFLSSNLTNFFKVANSNFSTYKNIPFDKKTRKHERKY